MPSRWEIDPRRFVVVNRKTGKEASFPSDFYTAEGLGLYLLHVTDDPYTVIEVDPASGLPLDHAALVREVLATL